MSDPVRAVFVFGADGDLLVFPSTEAAADWMEPVDVQEGEYVAVFTLDGRRVDVTAVDEHVSLAITEVAEDAEMRRRLHDFASRTGIPTGQSDPEAIANYLRRTAWESRWPRWPRWLDRRIHGVRPDPL